MILTWPPQLLQISMSMLNTRVGRYFHVEVECILAAAKEPLWAQSGSSAALVEPRYEA